MDYGKAIRDGALAGGAATVVMSGVMLGAGEAGLMGEQPPERITAAVAGRLGVPTGGERETDLLATLTHFGFGMAAGALFAVLDRRVAVPLPPALRGVLFGLLVWAASYRGWVPALGIMPPPERDRPGRPTAMVLAHIAYGAVLGALVRRARSGALMVAGIPRS